MKKTMKWLLAVLLFFMSFFANSAVIAKEDAPDVDGKVPEGFELHVNPLYKDILSDEYISDFRRRAAESYTQPENTDTDAPLFSTESAAVSFVKSQMVSRESSIRFRITSGVADSDPQFMSSIIEGAFEYTESCTGQEGDALRWVCGMWGSSSSWSGNIYTINYTVDYYTNASQEAVLTSEVNAALSGMKLNGKTETEKIRSIHDYICDRVNYDYDNLQNPTYMLQYTAYAAMHNRTSVCQGYAVLFYRMCKDAGLSVRVVTSLDHAWNIVRIGSLYYNIDTTWDGQDDETYHIWYLKGMREFPDHFREEPYDGDAFYDAFPMYLDPAMDKNNLSYTFNTVSGSTVSTNAAGRRKIIVFGDFLTDYYSQDAAEKMASFSNSEIDIYMVDVENATKSNLASYANGLGGSLIFCYDAGSTAFNAMMNYMSQGDYGGNYYTYPMIVYIDVDNKYQSYFMGPANTGNIMASITAYLHTEPGWQKIGGNWFYYDESGRMAKGWKLIDEKWYYFGSNGVMVTGWKQISGKWYFFNGSGDMAVGWAKISNIWYYFAESGEMATGWQSINGKWYYFTSSGAMVTGWQKLNGKWYFFNGGGDMAVGWAKINNTWYYFTESGAMATGWQNISGAWYYFTSSGAMVTGWQQLGGRWYYFNTSGAMLTGLTEINGIFYYFSENGDMATGWRNINGTWYYFTSSGAMVTGWLQLGGKWYYFSTDGAMLTGMTDISGTFYFFTENGDMVAGWVQINEDWYYFQPNGSMRTGWMLLGNKWYYFESNGIMVTGQKEISGIMYIFDDNGVCLNPNG